jgi:hypothetical protein
MGPRRGEDGGEGRGGVVTVGGIGTFWSLDIVESVVDDDGDGSSMCVRCGQVQDAVLRHFPTFLSYLIVTSTSPLGYLRLFRVRGLMRASKEAGWR